MYTRILVPLDGTACSYEAMTHAIAIAKAMRSSIVFFYAMDTSTEYREGVVSMAGALDKLSAQGEVLVERARKIAADSGVHATGELLEGSPAEAITQRATDFDLVVMGSHGKGLFKRFAVGSVTEAVLHRITGPLLIVRCRHADSTSH
jgi:nucleotide-binding universal stress UspA family protein